jgi:NAD dependent epimerase/dehydratase family enzyme
MKIVIPGGSGHVGTILALAFHQDGHDVVVLSRCPQAQPWRVVRWDGATLAAWSGDLDGCDAVINLAGRSVKLPVHCRESKGNPRVARALDARCRTGDRAGDASATRVAAGEYRDDLFTSL